MAPRGAKLADIKTVESHVHALGQCRRIIRKLGIKPIVSGDTAGSARIVAERGDKHCASIASRLAAEIYGLDILAEDVEDETHNTTRFVVLAREEKWAEQGSGPLVTTFVFRVRNLPAALYKALGGFATNGVNMTKLESYMVDGEFSATQFYADVDGHPDGQGPRLCAGGTEILLARIPHRRRLPGAAVPRDVQRDGGMRRYLSSRRTPGPIPRDLSIGEGRLTPSAKLEPVAMGPGVRRDDVTPPLSCPARTHPPAGYTTSCARRGRRPR